MFETLVTTQDQALCHLYFHCCLKDGVLTDTETDALAERFVTLGLQKDVNFKNEMHAYRSYKDHISDEMIYLEHLLRLINPTNELALYSHCAELAISDELLDSSEEILLKNIATILEIDERKQNVIKSLVVERKVVETKKIL
jgi:uncharacterized tellurite resistance protein B-like protein